MTRKVLKIKDLILKTEKVDWQSLKDLQPINLKNNYHAEKVKKSLINNGFASSIYVWQDKDDIYIIDGHCRNDVLRDLKNDGYEIPDKLNCTFLDLPNKKTAVKYLLQVFNQKTNPVNQGSLDIWLEELDIDLPDLEIELEDLHIELDEEEEVEEQQEVEEDEVPELKEEPFVVKGDLFELVDEEQGLTHRVLCGDSTMIDDVEKVMNGEKADMVFTDPPYNINSTGGGSSIIAKNLLKQKEEIDFISSFDPLDFLNNIHLVFNKKKNNSYIFCNKELLPNYLNWAVENKYSFNVLIWKKPNAIPIKDSHRPDIEYLLHFRNNAIWNYGLKDVNYSRCLEYGRENGLHPTMKPIELIANELFISSNKNSLVIDLFLGSGSTLIACQQTKRKCYGIELDENYCGVVITRWKNYMEKENKKFTIKRNGEEFNYS